MGSGQEWSHVSLRDTLPGFRFSRNTPPKATMASSTSNSSVFTAQATSISQGDVSTSASTLASVAVTPSESIEIFALDQIHDFYYNGYSQDEADVLTLFLGQCNLRHFLHPETETEL
jgi:hypothetical protein